MSQVGRQAYQNAVGRYEAFRTEASQPADITDDSDNKPHERAASRQRMEQTYSNMMSTYARQQENLANQPKWVHPKTKGSEMPHPCTLTHVNQTQDLMKAESHMAISAEAMDSSEWLSQHSIEKGGLTVKQLMDKGQIGQPGMNNETGKVQQHLKFESSDINEFECKLNMSIESYTNRIKWLLQGSRRIFGLLKGDNVAVIVDSSDANCGFGRLTIFQESLMHLIDEQLSQRKTIYLTAFGTNVQPLWESPMNVSTRTLEESKHWVESLQPSGGCNLLKALRHTLSVKGIDSVMIILGTTPDQNEDILCHYVDEMIVGREQLTIQTVAYDCNNHLTNVVLRGISKSTAGRYHCYASTNEEQIYTGDDISSLLSEIHTAQDVINKIKDMRQGLFGTALVSVMNEITAEVAKLPQSRFLPRPPGHENPLRLDMPKFQPQTSDDWLAHHGLKGRSLDLYQVLAPNAYSYKEEFIPVIRKTVSSQVHQKAMAQFPWHDGSVRNVHVDMTQLYDYQKQLGAAVRLYEKRLDWLSSASRKIFGTIVERNVIFLVDLSAPNIKYLVHIQHSMRLLLEQQLANKDFFNIIVFGSKPVKFMPTMVQPTPENLQKAWRWILECQCEGSRNFLSTLRTAVENDEESKHDVEPEGVYVFTSGVPDQNQEALISYAEECTVGHDLRVHVILFNVDDYDAEGAIPGRYANITSTAETLRMLAHCTSGRFHWFRETGIIESDDIAAITQEIDRGLNFSKKCAMLVDSIKKKYNLEAKDFKQLSIAKHACELSGNNDTRLASKSLTWRPSSAKKELTESSNSSRPSSAKLKGSQNKVQQSFFYTDGKKECGSVITKYPNQTARNKKLSALNKTVVIPDKEDQNTSKQWLRKYSLSKLKLDLNKLVSGPECKHAAKSVKILNKTVESRVYNVFPTINVNGVSKYLQLRPSELKSYEDEVKAVLHRYLRRLQWLLSGSRWVFGTVIGKHCVILIDTSGSMQTAIDELKKELAALIWDQLHKHRVSFNLISFSKSCQKWQESCVPPTEENCHDAVQWVAGLNAHGNTCTLEALEMAFADRHMESIYLLTDGKPDTSTGMVLKRVEDMNDDRNVVINTISFQCDDSIANSFLQTLSRQTTGRYHRCHSDFEAQKIIHKLLTDMDAVREQREVRLPEFEGDDMQRLVQEIELARTFLVQAKGYRNMYEKHQSGADEDSNKTSSKTSGNSRNPGNSSRHHCELSTDPPRPSTSRPASARPSSLRPGSARPAITRPGSARPTSAKPSAMRPTSAKV